MKTVSMNKKIALIISGVAAIAILVLIVISLIVSSLQSNRSESSVSEYASVKKDIESLKSSFIELTSQGERYVGSIVLNIDGVSLEKARLDAIRNAHSELETKISTLKTRTISDPALEKASNDTADKATRAADEFMALSYAATTFVECLSAPNGAPSEPEEFESYKIDLVNCRDVAKQLSTVESKTGRDYGKPQEQNADAQLSFYDDLEKLGDFSSDKNYRDYAKIDEKIFESTDKFPSIRQPRDVIEAQNEASSAYNESYSSLIKQVEKKVRSESGNG